MVPTFKINGSDSEGVSEFPSFSLFNGQSTLKIVQSTSESEENSEDDDKTARRKILKKIRRDQRSNLLMRKTIETPKKFFSGDCPSTLSDTSFIKKKRLKLVL